MKIVYTGEDAPRFLKKSIFLAGPTPRNAEAMSWRPYALRALENQSYDGVVFVPEFRNGRCKMPDGWTYDMQCNWEHKCMDMSDIIIFWVPRKLKTMPAFTTNVEFGLYANSGKIILGAPPKAVNNGYLKFVAGKLAIPVSRTLADTVKNAVEIIGGGAPRVGSECRVPLNVWRAPSFQNWYRDKTNAGHKLKNARVEFTIRKGQKKDWIYMWGLWVDIEVSGENRRKYNEHVISRPDISAVLMYKPGTNLQETEIALVKEFRSPARTADGFIWELPGGSTFDLEKTPGEIASEEAFEETGLKIEPLRFKKGASRQLAGTLSGHKANLFSAELKEEEMAWLKSQKGIVHGNHQEDESGERTYVEIKALKEIMSNELLDWSDIGMILSVLK